MRYGFDYISSGSYAGDWSELYFPVDTTVTLTTTKGDSVTTTFTEGTSIVGTYVGISISSGGIIAYRRSDTEKFSLFTGLLDDYPATAAYSLRLLDSTYTGSAIRVRRASDNAEQDIGFSGSDLDTASLTSFCTGTNGFVTTWYDQAGSNDATQATAGNQPKIYDSSTGVVLENGKAAIDFDGIAHFLKTSVFSSIAQPFTSFFIGNPDNATFIIDGNATYQNALRNSVSGNFEIRNASLTISASFTQGNQILGYALSNGSNSEIAVNAGAATLGTVGANSLTALTFGRAGSSSLFGKVKIQEAIIYSSDQSANRTQIESNINSHYSIYP